MRLRKEHVYNTLHETIVPRACIYRFDRSFLIKKKADLHCSFSMHLIQLIDLSFDDRDFVGNITSIFYMDSLSSFVFFIIYGSIGKFVHIRERIRRIRVSQRSLLLWLISIYDLRWDLSQRKKTRKIVKYDFQVICEFDF